MSSVATRMAVSRWLRRLRPPRESGKPGPSRLERLWPFSPALALAGVPALWIVFAVVLWGGHHWMKWPTTQSSGGLLYLAAAISLIPIVLLLLDYAAQRRAAFSIRSFSVDFSKDTALPARPSVTLDSSLGFEGVPISDSSVVAIHSLLKQTSGADAVRLDIKSGDAWWETRLFAVCAGAASSGRPSAIVIVGDSATPDRTTSGAFLGWMRPRDALRRFMEQRENLKLAYDRAEAISRQLTMFGPPDLRLSPPAGIVQPPPPAPMWPPPKQLPGPLAPLPGAPQLAWPVADYAMRDDFQNLGEDAFLRVLLDVLGKYEQSLMPIGPPRITVGVLHDLFDGVMDRHEIDLAWAPDRQLEAFLNSTGDYVALVERSQFVRLLPRHPAESAILRQLIAPAEAAVQEGP
jgi:hypothetical protein